MINWIVAATKMTPGTIAFYELYSGWSAMLTLLQSINRSALSLTFTVLTFYDINEICSSHSIIHSDE